MRQFLCVALFLVASSSAEKIKLGDIETFHHGAGGEVFALDEKTLMIKDFTYDGAGPDAFFWVGPEGSPSNVPDETKTKILAHPYVEPGYYEYRDQSAPILQGSAKEQITLRLPENMKVGDIKWLSVWCRKFSVDFGNLIFPTDLNLPKSPATGLDLPAPLAPVDNSVVEPEPEPESEPEPEPEHDHDHDHDHGHAEPHASASVMGSSLTAIASIVLAVIYM